MSKNASFFVPPSSDGRSALRGTPSEAHMMQTIASVSRPDNGVPVVLGASTTATTAVRVAESAVKPVVSASTELQSPRRGVCRAQVMRMVAEEASLVFLVLVLLLTTGLIEWYLAVTEHAFIERDPTISMPFVEASVSTLHLFLACFVLPAIVVLVIEFVLGLVVLARPQLARLLQPKCSRSFGWLVAALLAALCTTIRLLTVIGCTITLTNAVKAVAGRPRPNFFALCNYKGYGDALTVVPHGEEHLANLSAYMAATTSGAFGQYSHCSAAAKDIRQAHLSFPSGHSSISFAGMVFLAAYCVAKLDALRKASAECADAFDARIVLGSSANGSGSGSEEGGDGAEGGGKGRAIATAALRFAGAIATSQAAAITVSSLCFAFATWVATGRYFEYWHHPSDILAGAVLGSFCALVLRHDGRQFSLTGGGQDDEGVAHARAAWSLELQQL